MTPDNKILIIDDENSVLLALGDAFTRKGFVCSTATNGKEGLACALLEKPNLIVLDLVMPVMDGFAMLKKLREDSWGRSVHVIILTNLSADSSNLVRDAVQTYPDYYLVKSDWPINAIVAKTEQILTT